jgi:Spy/CpxP family protein refolding chaperone
MKKILFSLLLTAIFAVPAFSQMKDMPMKEHRQGYGQMMEMSNIGKMGDMMGMCIEHADHLGLNDDQIMKMKSLHREMEKSEVRFTADRKIAKIDLRAIMEVKDFDLEKASSAVKKIAEIETAHHLKMLKAMKEMRAILTDEQFMKMKKIMSMKPCEGKMVDCKMKK